MANVEMLYTDRFAWFASVYTKSSFPMYVATSIAMQSVKAYVHSPGILKRMRIVSLT